jgi:hypothetical protein
MFRRLGQIVVVLGAVLVLAAIVLGLLYSFAPWKGWIETRLLAELQARGYENVSFQIENIGPHQVVLKDIVIGKETPLVLSRVALNYSPQEIRAGNFRDLSLSGLVIDVVKTADGWSLSGLDVLPKKEGAANPALDIPAILSSLPFSSLEIEDSRIRISGGNISGEIPFSVALLPKQSLEIKTQETTIKSGERDISLSAVTMTAAPDKNNWKGNWALPQVSGGEDFPVPSLWTSIPRGRKGLSVKNSTVISAWFPAALSPWFRTSMPGAARNMNGFPGKTDSPSPSSARSRRSRSSRGFHPARITRARTARGRGSKVASSPFRERTGGRAFLYALALT